MWHVFPGPRRHAQRSFALAEVVSFLREAGLLNELSPDYRRRVGLVRPQLFHQQGWRIEPIDINH
jgi:hypothetical protein